MQLFLKKKQKYKAASVGFLILLGVSVMLIYNLILLADLMHKEEVSPNDNSNHNYYQPTTTTSSKYLENALTKVQARNAYLRPGNNDKSQWGWKTGGTGRFQTVDVARAQVLIAALQPTATCPWTLRRTNCVSGGQFDGGKWTCGLAEMRRFRRRGRTKTRAPPRCIVYSFGSNGDDFFENDVLAQNPDCEMHIFDPTSGEAPAAWEGKYQFHALGLCAEDGATTFTLEGTNTRTKGKAASNSSSYPCQSLSNIMKDLGHTHVDILKADIEGMEWNLLQNWGSEKRVGQLLLEMHFWHPSGPKHLPELLRDNIIPMEKLGYFIQTLEPVAAEIEAYEVTFLNVNWSADAAFGRSPVYDSSSRYPSTPNVDIS